ncbi:MAG TPA: class I SAM-dependent methyltransferase [Bosea sp. (in: a-proteobacteria)]|uniref:class I SAM-dependent methyltransferase n=1 Tax=Bosea sp. (in: a-proteobacteria) TaxID=1871050 RepID=UPI002DDCC2D3|nr:class I SAM-dependent methyltransferase [Bosea sp. (in: a-proteobacteria)]HEV2552958.1 class I SAM-dependent methyltransferase [Bosea sp. (in: a-proteobacteria)]
MDIGQARLHKARHRERARLGNGMTKAATSEGGHLDYYKEHGISPVRYAMDDLSQHLQLRDSLYRSIGLPQVAFRGSDILEIAPGSGQNSLYLAVSQPRSLTLVEPNPAGLRDIQKLYDTLSEPHTAPILHPARLQEFNPGKLYDVVLCENWLGALPAELELLRKLAGLVAPGGALVLTIVPLAGFFPNVMRKLLALRVVPSHLGFDERTAALVEIFGPHLATIPNMTRSHRDWVHDCMVNPHYLNVGLPFETVVETIGDDMAVLGTYPKITIDWRWFKALKGTERRFNELLIEAVAANIPSLLDYRRTFPAGAPGANAAIDRHFGTVHRLALAWQAAFEADDSAEVQALTGTIGSEIHQISELLSEIDGDLAAAVRELEELWLSQQPTAEAVRDMPLFGSLFGRETFYAAFTRGQPQVEGKSPVEGNRSDGKAAGA